LDHSWRSRRSFGADRGEQLVHRVDHRGNVDAVHAVEPLLRILESQVQVARPWKRRDDRANAWAERAPTMERDWSLQAHGRRAKKRREMHHASVDTDHDIARDEHIGELNERILTSDTSRFAPG